MKISFSGIKYWRSILGDFRLKVNGKFRVAMTRRSRVFPVKDELDPVIMDNHCALVHTSEISHVTWR